MPASNNTAKGPKSASKLSKAFADETLRKNMPNGQESYFFFTMLKHQITKPEFDWAAIAEDNRLKNAETAKVCSRLCLLFRGITL